jgi:hypothetical protein
MRARKSAAHARWRFGMPKVVMRIAVIVSLLVSWASVAQAQDPQLVRVLQGLLQKYQKCILEQYENQVDENDPNKTNPRALGPLRDSAICVAGNMCTRASRQAMYFTLKAQADRGDPTNFETNLKTAILTDCFQCAKHGEFHTKQMHCTLECKGDQSWSANPFKFDAGVGPCFEGCKAGVDISQLVRDVENDIRNILQGLAQDIGVSGPRNTHPQETGGPSIATNYSTVDPGSVPEARCEPRPLGIFPAPADLLDWTPTDAPPFKQAETNFNPGPPASRQQYNPGALSINDPKLDSMKLNLGSNEGRLRSDLRDAAAHRNPIECLCKSAAAFAVNDQADGNAFADLSVTGRNAFAAFRAQPPQDPQILSCLRSNPKTKGLPEQTLQKATSQSLNRAYRVLHILRTGGWPGNSACSQARQNLGYIAVSGEDDQPHRPVNVASAEFPQYDLQVPVVVRSTGRTITVRTRYMIADSNAPAPDQLGNCAFTGRTIPADRTPVLAPDAEIFLYIPGGDSRLEEALDLTHALHALEGQRHKNYTVISMDLPTSGYADNIDQTLIQPPIFDGHAGGGVTGLEFAPNKYNAPILDFAEDFIVSFINTLDRSVPSLRLTQHNIVPLGGSLGGNLAFRLGRPRADAPWIQEVVSWSTASIWPSLADSGANHAGLATPWYFAGGSPDYLPETPGARRTMFYGGFDWQSKAGGFLPVGGSGLLGLAGGGRPQAELWYRDGWECKPSHLRFARIDRYETYDRNFRLWHWRMGMEQLMFSQQISKPGTNPPEPLYLSNTKPMLLLCGMDDLGGDLCAHTRDVAPKMVLTPGRALFLETTGHSIHNERPHFLALEITAFVDGQTSAQTTPSSPAMIRNRFRTIPTEKPLAIAQAPAAVTSGAISIAHLPALAASACQTLNGATCLKPTATRPPTTNMTAIVTVTSGGAAVGEATVRIVNQSVSALTGANGNAVISFRACESAGKPTRVPCEATVAKPGYQELTIKLP